MLNAVVAFDNLTYTSRADEAAKVAEFIHIDNGFIPDINIDFRMDNFFTFDYFSFIVFLELSALHNTGLFDAHCNSIFL